MRIVLLLWCLNLEVLRWWVCGLEVSDVNIEIGFLWNWLFFLIFMGEVVVYWVVELCFEVVIEMVEWMCCEFVVMLVDEVFFFCGWGGYVVEVLIDLFLIDVVIFEFVLFLNVVVDCVRIDGLDMIFENWGEYCWVIDVWGIEFFV